MKKNFIAFGLLICMMFSVMLTGCFGDDTYTADVEKESSDTLVSSKTSVIWTKGEFKDEFDNPTGEKYIKTTVNGTYNDTFTEEGNLKAEVRVSETDVSIYLWENGTDEIELLYGDSLRFDITVLDQNNIKHQYLSYLYDGKSYLDVDDYGMFSFESAVDLIALLYQTQGTVKFYIENSDDKDNNYSFSINTEGFADLYNEILPLESDSE